MKKLLLFFLFTACILSSSAQTLLESPYKNLQVLEDDLKQAKSPFQKTDALISLYLYHALHSERVNKKTAIEYQKQLEIYIHQTNEPELIARAFLYLIRPALGEEKKKTIDRLYEFAKLNNLNFYKALAKIKEAEYYFDFRTDPHKAAQLVSEGINLSKDLNDSLRTWVYYEAGWQFTNMNNHLQALALAFQANEMAAKIHSLELQRWSNQVCAFIYYNIKNYNKSISYHLKTLQLLKKLGHWHYYARNNAIIARHYFVSGQPMLGEYHLTEAYRVADSLKGSRRLYGEITGNTITGVSLSGSKEKLEHFLKNYRKYFPGDHFLENVVLARAYINIGNTDSAKSLINKAKEYSLNNQSADNRQNYFYTLARIASYNNNRTEAITNYQQCLSLALAQNDLDACLQYTDSLKNILANQNAFQQAFHYSNLGDSLQRELTKQQDKEDITRQEVAALEKEKEMQATEKEKEKNQRHNLQYLGITFGVVALFVSLLVMGIFKVSPRTIKILSFFSFLLFFEFIFLIFKKQISVVTHGEPWKDLLFMVLLAAVMVPFHHWGEHRVVEFLSTQKFSLFGTKFSRIKTVIKKEIVS